MSNVWRSLDLPLNIYEVELDFKWWINCIISDIARTPEIDVDPAANPLIAHVLARTTTSATFQINDTRIYASVVTLPIDNKIKFLENIEQVFERTISWKKYRLEIKQNQKATI